MLLTVAFLFLDEEAVFLDEVFRPYLSRLLIAVVE